MQNRFLQFLGIVKKSGNLVEGYNKCEELIKQNKIYLLIISTDCSDNTKDKFKGYCDRYNIPYLETYTKEELAQNIGRAEINLLAVSNKTMSEKLMEIWKENNN
jgi:ribosomal protein L7Ae-like RNA K-turn-binding protein